MWLACGHFCQRGRDSWWKRTAAECIIDLIKPVCPLEKQMPDWKYYLLFWRLMRKNSLLEKTILLGRKRTRTIGTKKDVRIIDIMNTSLRRLKTHKKRGHSEETLLMATWRQNPHPTRFCETSPVRIHNWTPLGRVHTRRSLEKWRCSSWCRYLSQSQKCLQQEGEV